ncbi:MAG: ABC transporter permease, partial [Halanaerobiaceae bacterium]
MSTDNQFNDKNSPAAGTDNKRLSAQSDKKQVEGTESKTKKKKIEKRLTIATWISIFAVWYLITKFEVFSPTLLPSPLRVCKAFIRLLDKGYNGVPLWIHLAASFRRLFLALALAISTAVPLGLLSGYFD